MFRKKARKKLDEVALKVSGERKPRDADDHQGRGEGSTMRYVVRLSLSPKRTCRRDHTPISRNRVQLLTTAEILPSDVARQMVNCGDVISYHLSLRLVAVQLVCTCNDDLPWSCLACLSSPCQTTLSVYTWQSARHGR